MRKNKYIWDYKYIRKTKQLYQNYTFPYEEIKQAQVIKQGKY